MKKIQAFSPRKNISVSQLVNSYSNLGFQASSLSKAVDVIEEMIKDKDCTVFLGMAGALVPAGLKNIIVDALNRKLIDVFVTTGANFTHDLIEDLGGSHYLLDENKIDDINLNKKNLYRMYNTAMPNSVYKKLEKFISKNYSVLSKIKTSKEFLWKLGELSPGNGILKTAYKNKIPIFCPALSDSGIGLIMWGQIVQGKPSSLNAFDDLKEILDISWTAKKTGVIYIGGGTPKNYIQQACQFSKKAIYGVQITTDRQEWGGSSGAPLVEGISWNKLDYKAKNINVYCEATIAFPLIYSALLDRL